jgi:phage terminase large subunit-like protein
MGRPAAVNKHAAADRAVAVINQLTHTSGPFARQPFQLRKWQQQIVRAIFTTGPLGLRIYRTVLLMLPRKNGKTEIVAALAIVFLLFDDVIGGVIICAAADLEQASLVFNAIVTMLQHDPELEAQVEILVSQKRIVHRASGTQIRAVSGDAFNKHGLNCYVVLYDELHAAPNRDLWDVLATSQGAHAQPMLIAISTAGYDRHSILWELYQHAKRVLENPALDPTFLPLLFEAPIDADWTDERVWAKANPALGDFRSLEEMRTMAARAKEIPAQENTFRRLYLNQWTEQADRWIPLAAWDACSVVAA